MTHFTLEFLQVKRLFVLSLLGVFFIFPPQVLGKIGVGVGTGKINVDERLLPGIIYKIPAITVINTGDEKSSYELVVSQRETQPELKPESSWISYSPEKFDLEPDEVQVVDVTINLPITAQPGDYFAFLEAHPVKNQDGKSTSVSIAAASKLYFTVEPGNIFQGIYYKIVSWWQLHTPWTNIGASLVVGVLAWLIVRRFVHIDISLSKKSEPKKFDPPQAD